MLDAAIIGTGRGGHTLVESVQGRNDAGLRFAAGCTGRSARATGPRDRASGCTRATRRCSPTRR